MDAVENPDGLVYARLADEGIDRDRIEQMLRHEQWGQLVDAFGVISVLGAVVAGWPEGEA